MTTTLFTEAEMAKSVVIVATEVLLFLPHLMQFQDSLLLLLLKFSTVHVSELSGAPKIQEAVYELTPDFWFATTVVMDTMGSWANATKPTNVITNISKSFFMCL